MTKPSADFMLRNDPVRFVHGYARNDPDLDAGRRTFEHMIDAFDLAQSVALLAWHETRIAGYLLGIEPPR